MYAVVRLKGTINARPEVRDTLRMLRLTRNNYCTLVEETPHYKGMLQVVKDYVAFGKVGADTIEMLLRMRGEVVGGNKLTDQYVKENTLFSSIRELAEKLASEEITLKDVPGLRPVFRMHPARKGLRSIKKPYKIGGDLGERDDIEELLYRMR